jgi:hypothetical protein
MSSGLALAVIVGQPPERQTVPGLETARTDSKLAGLDHAVAGQDDQVDGERPVPPVGDLNVEVVVGGVGPREDLEEAAVRHGVDEGGVPGGEVGGFHPGYYLRRGSPFNRRRGSLRPNSPRSDPGLPTTPDATTPPRARGHRQGGAPRIPGRSTPPRPLPRRRPPVAPLK